MRSSFIVLVVLLATGLSSLVNAASPTEMLEAVEAGKKLAASLPISNQAGTIADEFFNKPKGGK